MTENMVTYISRVLHLIVFITGDRLTQLSKSQIPQIMGNVLTSHVRLRCPFLTQSTTESQHNYANCVDSRGGGQLPGYGHQCSAGNSTDIPDSKPSFPVLGYGGWILSNRHYSSLRHWDQPLHILK